MLKKVAKNKGNISGEVEERGKKIKDSVTCWKGPRKENSVQLMTDWARQTDRVLCF